MFFSNKGTGVRQAGSGYKVVGLSKMTDKVTFDASRVVPTASENRMKNLAVFVCIVYE